MDCPKCGAKMTRMQRVNKEVNGLEEARFECACGWTIEEDTGKGYWPDQKE